MTLHTNTIVLICNNIKYIKDLQHCIISLYSFINYFIVVIDKSFIMIVKSNSVLVDFKFEFLSISISALVENRFTKYLRISFIPFFDSIQFNQYGSRQRAVPMVVWWLQNRQTTVPNHVFSPYGVVCRVFSPFLTT